MDPTCGKGCNFCYPNEWRYKIWFDCCNCIKVTELRSGLDKIIKLNCKGCDNLTFIPSLPSLASLNCSGCSLLTFIPDLPNIYDLTLYNCVLLTEWKQKGGNVREMYSHNCPLLHLHPSLFIRFNGKDSLFRSSIGYILPRPRNGVSSRLLSAFTVCKKLYCYELPARVCLEVSLNAILYAPGGVKYLELADRYKNGF